MSDILVEENSCGTSTDTPQDKDLQGCSRNPEGDNKKNIDIEVSSLPEHLMDRKVLVEENYTKGSKAEILITLPQEDASTHRHEEDMDIAWTARDYSWTDPFLVAWEEKSTYSKESTLSCEVGGIFLMEGGFLFKGRSLCRPQVSIRKQIGGDEDYVLVEDRYFRPHMRKDANVIVRRKSIDRISECSINMEHLVVSNLEGNMNFWSQSRRYQDDLLLRVKRTFGFV